MITPCVMIRFGLLAATAAMWTMVPAAGLAQSEAEFTPVTDAML